MNFDDIGTGTGIGGFIGIVLTALGLKSRLNNQDKIIDELKESVVYKSAFEQFEKRFDDLHENVKSINGKLDTLIQNSKK